MMRRGGMYNITGIFSSCFSGLFFLFLNDTLAVFLKPYTIYYEQEKMEANIPYFLQRYIFFDNY